MTGIATDLNIKLGRSQCGRPNTARGGLDFVTIRTFFEHLTQLITKRLTDIIMPTDNWVSDVLGHPARKYDCVQVNRHL